MYMGLHCAIGMMLKCEFLCVVGAVEELVTSHKVVLQEQRARTEELEENKKRLMQEV